VSANAGAQQRSQVTTEGSAEGKSAQGTVTVTVTVASSVGILIGPNGEQILVVANAPAAHNMMVLTAVPTAMPAATGRPENIRSMEKTPQK